MLIIMIASSERVEPDTLNKCKGAVKSKYVLICVRWRGCGLKDYRGSDFKSATVILCIQVATVSEVLDI